MGMFLTKLLLSAYVAEFCLQTTAAGFGQFFESRYPKDKDSNKEQSQPAPSPAPVTNLSSENRWASLRVLILDSLLADFEVGLLIRLKNEWFMGGRSEYSLDQETKNPQAQG